MRPPKSLLKPQYIVALYRYKHLSMSEIALRASISRTAVWKILQQKGVNTHKGPDGGTRVKVTCDFCGKVFEWTRSRWRNSISHIHRYCSTECYYAAIENPGYRPWRQGQRLARAIINQYFSLQEGNIVHHKDGDGRNNDRSNFMVFASQADHMAYHRGREVKPLWDGSYPYLDTQYL